MRGGGFATQVPVARLHPVPTGQSSVVLQPHFCAMHLWPAALVAQLTHADALPQAMSAVPSSQLVLVQQPLPQAAGSQIPLHTPLPASQIGVAPPHASHKLPFFPQLLFDTSKHALLKQQPSQLFDVHSQRPSWHSCPAAHPSSQAELSRFDAQKPVLLHTSPLLQSNALTHFFAQMPSGLHERLLAQSRSSLQREAPLVQLKSNASIGAPTSLCMLEA